MTVSVPAFIRLAQLHHKAPRFPCVCPLAEGDGVRG